jgi:ribosome-associated heat shock protein Hsp15
METPASVRLDKWLWAVRLFKTRRLADDACHAGHVKIAGVSVKSSHSVRPGETLNVLAGGIRRTIKVLASLDRRVGAALVSQALEDLTPAAEYERARQQASAAAATSFPTGHGRPTKKDRRRLEEGRMTND